MTYVLGPCPVPGCSHKHGVIVSKRGPARPYTGPIVSPLRPASRSAQYEPAAGESADGAALSEAPDPRLTLPRAGVAVRGHTPPAIAAADPSLVPEPVLVGGGAFTRRAHPRLAAGGSGSPAAGGSFTGER